MKHSLPLLFTWLLLALSALAEELDITPGSDLWGSLYHPAYEKPSEIPTSNPLRKELFNQLRAKLEPKAGEPLLFLGSLRAYRNWALFQGASQDRNGGPIAYPDLGNSDTVALWLRTKDGWTLVDYEAGHSDVFYLIWTEAYGMPKAFFNQ
ncbi:MAG: hypothetical protein AAF555_07195 [Verrucomicrobiota bacterium]